MLKKIIILSMLFAATIFISGCIDNTNKENPVNNTDTNKSDQIPTVNFSGFTFMAVHETQVDIGNFSRKAIEGVYRTDRERTYIFRFSRRIHQKLL
jgi:hypothetical protein